MHTDCNMEKLSSNYCLMLLVYTSVKISKNLEDAHSASSDRKAEGLFCLNWGLRNLWGEEEVLIWETLKAGFESPSEFPHPGLVQRASVYKVALEEGSWEAVNVFVRLYLGRGALRQEVGIMHRLLFSLLETVLCVSWFFHLPHFDFCEGWFPCNQPVLGKFQGSRKMMGQVLGPRESCRILLWNYWLFY